MPSAAKTVHPSGPPQGGYETPEASDLFQAVFLSPAAQLFAVRPRPVLGNTQPTDNPRKVAAVRDQLGDSRSYLSGLFLGHDFPLIMCILSENLQLP